MRVLLVISLVAMVALLEGRSVQFDNCDDLFCVDPVWTNGLCPLTCPRGQTCREPFTLKVLEANKKYDIYGRQCKCKDTWFPDWDIADCKEKSD